VASPVRPGITESIVSLPENRTLNWAPFRERKQAKRYGTEADERAVVHFHQKYVPGNADKAETKRRSGRPTRLRDMSPEKQEELKRIYSRAAALERKYPEDW
jgi:hypothetical protein